MFGQIENINIFYLQTCTYKNFEPERFMDVIFFSLQDQIILVV